MLPAAVEAVEKPTGLSPEEQEQLDRALRADEKATSTDPAPGADAGREGTASPSPARAFVSTLQSMNPDIAFIGDVALSWFNTEEPLQSGGHDPQATGFTLQQLEMSVQSAVDPYFRFDAFVVFSQFGVEVEEVYATTLTLPANLQMRIGQFLTRMGRLNAMHPHSWEFVDQPFALGRVMGGEGNRGLGLELSYLAPLPWYLEIFGSVTDAAGEATARSFFGGEQLTIQTPLDVQSTLVVKQFFPLTEDWSLLWGMSAATGPNPTGHDNRTDLYGTDLYLKYRPTTYGTYLAVALQTEWFYRRRQIPDDVVHDVSGYAYLAWRFAQRWTTALRHELGTPSWNRDGQVGNDYLDPFWTDYRHRSSANLTFRPTEFSRIRLQCSSDILTWESTVHWAAFLAFEFAVGAHGAHTF